MKYDYVIILCASPLNDEGKFDELSSDGSYLGGPIRMKAAVDFYKSKRVNKFIVVGGGMEEKKEEKKWRKVNDMRKYLIKNKVPKKNIIRICSKSDTHGNMRAIYKTFKEKLKGKTVGVLTNFYHLPRAMRFAHDPQVKWNVKFIPICAESVIESVPTTYLRFVPEFLCRIFSDIQGLKNWEKGNYRNQNEPQKAWKGEIHPDDKELI